MKLRAAVAPSCLALASLLVVAAACNPRDEEPPPVGTDTGVDAGESAADAGPVVCPATDPASWLDKPGTQHLRVDDSETWRAQDSPHRVFQGTVAVNEGRTLTIEPCAIVTFGDLTGLEVGTSTTSRGDLVAVGSADKPILLRPAKDATRGWDGLLLGYLGGNTRLSYVTIEDAGRAAGQEPASITANSAAAAPIIDHTTLRRGGGVGLRLSYGAKLGPGSEGNVITAMAGVPLRVGFSAVGTILAGTYTGNGEDRAELVSDGNPLSVASTWHRLDVPWHLRVMNQTVSAVLTVEPGTRVIVEKSPGDVSQPSTTYEGNLEFRDGGGLVADGGSAAGQIVFEGEAADGPASWAGFNFHATAASGNKLNFVKVAKAGRVFAGHSPSEHCEGAPPNGAQAAVRVASAAQLSVANSEFRDVGAASFAITRSYCGDSQPQFGAAGLGNKFYGPMICGETDLMPCSGSCDPQFTCCTRNFVCHAPPL